jgi:steroid delta-isomerase-like uncharacterized protein
MGQNVERFRATHQAFNRRDFDAVLDAFAEDAVYEDCARNTTFRGRDGFRQFIEGWVEAFPDANVASASYIDAGDVVIAEFTGRGTQTGPLGPLPATGKRLNLPFCEILRFNAQGKIVSGSAYYDQLTMLTQLGHAQARQAGA